MKIVADVESSTRLIYVSEAIRSLQKVENVWKIVNYKFFTCDIYIATVTGKF